MQVKFLNITTESRPLLLATDILLRIEKKETSILRADERSQALETELFKELREWIMDFLGSLQATTMAVSKIDAICSMAEVSQSNNYVRPEMSDDGALSISDGRHPVIEVLREGSTLQIVYS